MLSPDFLFPRPLVFPPANPSNFLHCKCFSIRILVRVALCTVYICIAIFYSSYCIASNFQVSAHFFKDSNFFSEVVYSFSHLKFSWLD